jgi:hypothetical protein
VRPNLALGPIDSVAQYLLYVSIVVLGVLLPILVQKWRQRRQDAMLVQRTLAALVDEIGGNRRKLAVSRDSFTALAAAFDAQYRHYEEIWRRLREDDTADREPEPPESIDLTVTLPALLQTAWDVAHVSSALALLPREQLSRFTRAYYLQGVLAQNQSVQRDVAIQSEALDAPLDLRHRPNVEARLQALAVARGAVRNQITLSDATLQAYDAALAQCAAA